MPKRDHHIATFRCDPPSIRPSDELRRLLVAESTLDKTCRLKSGRYATVQGGGGAS